MCLLYNTELINKIDESFNIKILVDNDLPNSICNKCTRDINTAFQLKQLFINSQKILEDIIRNEEFDDEQTIKTIQIKEESIFCNDENLDAIIKDIVKEELAILTEPKDEIEDGVNDADNIEIDDCKLSNDEIDDTSTIERDEFNNFKCSDCGKCFRYPSKYKQHRNTHIRKSKLSTDETDGGTNNIEKDEFDNYKCGDCGKCFRYPSKYKLHRNTHIRKCKLSTDETDGGTSNIEKDEFDNYKCGDCGKCFRYLSKYKEHRKTHISKSLGLHCCKSCGRTYNRQICLSKHQQVCDGSNKKLKKPALCNQCGKSVMDLKQHTRVNHSTNRPHECPTCNKTFVYPYHLNMHIHVHGNQPKPHLCNECGKTFCTMTSLKEHTMNHHLGQKPYKCKLCNAEFCSRHGFRMHMAKHTNTRVRKYACTVCEKKFYTAEMLRNHMRIHTGERPYVCQICQKSFTQTGALSIHMKSHKILPTIKT